MSARHTFLVSTAVISDCKTYRYELRRIWQHGARVLVVCMLNPSTADASINDPTILTLIHFAKLWGYGGIVVINLFAYRSSTPSVLKEALRFIGPENFDHWDRALDLARQQGKDPFVLVAWGACGFDSRAQQFVELCASRGLACRCLGLTNGGDPKHPMARGRHRIPRDQQPIFYGDGVSDV